MVTFWCVEQWFEGQEQEFQRHFGKDKGPIIAKRLFQDGSWFRDEEVIFDPDTVEAKIRLHHQQSVEKGSANVQM